jgi:hypothetical protein
VRSPDPNGVDPATGDPAALKPKTPVRTKSPFSMLRSLRDASPGDPNSAKDAAKNKKKDPQKKVTRTADVGFAHVDGEFIPVAPKKKIEKNLLPGLDPDDPESYPHESDDMELQAMLECVDEFYYGVRLFPGQDGSKVYVGWATSRLHLSVDKLDRNFNQKDTSRCTLINTSSDGSIVSSLTRSECLMLSAIDLSTGMNDQEFSSSKIVANSVLIGCMVDVSTGVISFTFNGKETPIKLTIEPGTKLYPAVFVEPTTKEVLQIELGRVRNCLPLSAAMFPSLGKHVQPKCPPRLKLQFLQPIRWSRVPNANLRVHCLKMNNVLGWSLLCEEIVNTQAVYISEEDRWINVLELNESAVLKE